MTVDKSQVEKIVERVMQELTASPEEGPVASPADGSDGVFEQMEDAIQAAVSAQHQLVQLPLENREKVIQAIRDTGWRNREEYGRMELDETDLGSVTGTMLKMETACGVPGMEDIKPEVFTGDLGVTINERIPVGVIASVNAVTNAAPGIVHNAIMMIAGGNTVVINPHPKTKIISARVVKDLNQAIIAVGGPADCITTVPEPDIPTAQFLMTHPQINMIAVTGGHRVVEFATKTGKRVLAGGPGNPPVVVDETADLEHAARCIIRGASFSNCTPCSSEKEIFVVDSVADRLKALLIENGAYELNADQSEALVQKIFKQIVPGREPSVINLDYIGKPPNVILQRTIGLEIPSDTKIAIIEADKEHPLVWTEQIMPILPFVRCRDSREAMNMGVAAERGLRHTIVFHSKDLNNMAYMSSIADASQFVKNASSIGGLGIEGEGFKSLHIATGGEGLARPSIFTLIRRCVMKDDFRYRYGAGTI